MLSIFKKVDEILKILKSKPVVAEPTTGDLVRHQLGSIDLKDFESFLPKNESERKAYVQYIASGYKGYLDPTFKKLVQTQLEFIGKEATDWEKVIFARGTLNGISLIFEEFEKCFAEHIQDIMDHNQNFDAHNPINNE